MVIKFTGDVDGNIYENLIMLKKIVPSSEFARNVATLMTGTAVAQAVPIAVSPILTRLYTPDDFGVLALFISIVSIFSVVASARYELAILIPESDEDAVNIAALSILITTGFSFFLLIAAILFNKKISLLLENEAISTWLYFIPLVVLLLGVYNVLRYLSIRFKDFKSIAVSKTVKAVVSSAIKIGMGLLNLGVNGLMTGEIFANFFGNGPLVGNFLKKKDLLKNVSFVNIKKQAAVYVDFPKYSLWSGAANTLSLNLNSFFISLLFSITMLGQYSLVQRVVAMPMNLIGTAMSDVYFQRASQERQQYGNARNIFIKSFKALSIVAFFAMIVLIAGGEELFVFVFGESWRFAGSISTILSVLFAVRFVASPLSVSFSVFEKQKLSLLTTAIQLGVLVCVFFFSWLYSLTFYMFLLVYTVAMTIFYLFMLIMCYNIVSGSSTQGRSKASN